jgi:hypothetical protein
MSIDKIDQYIKGLYANESVPPPPGAEDALFERMAKKPNAIEIWKNLWFDSAAVLCILVWCSPDGTVKCHSID